MRLKIVLFVLALLLDGVGDEQAGVLLLIQQHHGSQISHSLLTVAWAGYHPNTLHLVGGTTTPLNEKLRETLIVLMPLGRFSVGGQAQLQSRSPEAGRDSVAQLQCPPLWTHRL